MEGRSWRDWYPEHCSHVLDQPLHVPHPIIIRRVPRLASIGTSNSCRAAPWSSLPRTTSAPPPEKASTKQQRLQKGRCPRGGLQLLARRPNRRSAEDTAEAS
ncbi:Hexose transporter HXT15 [Fusarium oxysporum f. sp. albedinis]|nr:Hexose transporter HXT15 [Fusarium oxysporum f. sp. albedinis]